MRDCISEGSMRTPPRRSAPVWIMIMFEPISAICSRMLRLEPCPMASMAMTEATPMMMPSMVRNPRNLLPERARRAMRMRFL